MIPTQPPPPVARRLHTMRRALIAAVSAVALTATSLTVLASPASAQTCSFSTFRNGTAHQQRTVENFGCSQVGARHQFLRLSTGQLIWTAWVIRGAVAESVYNPEYITGQGAGSS